MVEALSSGGKKVTSHASSGKKFSISFPDDPSLADLFDHQRPAASEATKSCQGLEGEGHSHAAPPADDFVFVAGDFETLPSALHAYDGHIC